MQRIMNASQHRVTRWPEISASSMRDPLAGRAGISVGSFRGGWCRHRIFARCETAGMFVSARSSDSKCAFSNLSRGRRARFFVHQPDIS